MFVHSNYTAILFLVFTVCFNDLLGAIIDDTGDSDHSQSIRNVKKNGWELVILRPPGSNVNMIIKRIDETLNLTCRIRKEDSTNGSSVVYESPDKIFKLSWQINSIETKSKNRVRILEDKTSVHLIIFNLSDSDAGRYSCKAEEVSSNHDSPPYADSIEVRIKPRQIGCSESSFGCPSGGCIHKRFLCDGKIDCKDGADESLTQCETDPCEGKLKCQNGRCMSVQYCCDHLVDANCTVRTTPECCIQLQSMHLNLGSSGGGGRYPAQREPYNNDMGFLQTTIYTVIGCAMAFMFIITILIIAICRVHLKRTALARYPTLRQDQDTWASMLMQPRVGPYLCNSTGLMVAYNINNGVQFVARPGMNPPPYSETTQGPLIDRMQPPPPYSSTDNLVSAAPTPGPSLNMGSNQSQSPTRHYQQRDRERETMEPLLSEAEETNNNGDVNGNSNTVESLNSTSVPVVQLQSDCQSSRSTEAVVVAEDHRVREQVESEELTQLAPSNESRQ